MNRPGVLRLIETDLGRIAETARPLAIDPWLAWSLLQAIRRGDVDLAERVAFTGALRRQGHWC